MLGIVAEKGFNVKAILSTHCHNDHCGVNEVFISRMKNPTLKVYGGDSRIPGLNHPLKHGDRFMVRNGLDG